MQRTAERWQLATDRRDPIEGITALLPGFAASENRQNNPLPKNKNHRKIIPRKGYNG
jgi:hypothetical protein